MIYQNGGINAHADAATLTAAEDHQTKNAQQLVEAEAALMVKNANTESELVQALLALAADSEKQERMKANIGKFARPNAADDIVNVIIDSCLVD